MTDGNTYAINKHLDDQEDYDALQEVTTELEQAEARIEGLEGKLARAVDVLLESVEPSEVEQAEADNIMLIGRIEELEAKLADQVEWVRRLADDLIAAEAKLAKAVAADQTEVIALIRKDAENGDISHGAAQWVIDTILAAQKGQDDE